MNKVQGVVLRVQDYKESDGIVDLMTEDAILTVRVRGLQKSTSKLRTSCQPFSFVEWIIEKKNGFPLLIQGRVIRYYYRIMEDLEKQSLCFLLRDIAFRSNMNPVLYHLWLDLLIAIQDQTSSVYTLACLFLREILLQEGIQPYTDGCVRCHRKDGLITFSEKDGGFVCRYCQPQPFHRMKKEQLISIYGLFHGSIEQVLSTLHLEAKDVLYWACWYEYHAQIQLKSLAFYKTVMA